MYFLDACGRVHGLLGLSFGLFETHIGCMYHVFFVFVGGGRVLFVFVGGGGRIPVS